MRAGIRRLVTPAVIAASAVVPAANGLPPAAAIEGTLRLPAQENALFAARAGSLFVLAVPPRPAPSITILRADPRGVVVRRRVPFGLSNYVADVSAGPYGIYVGTSVIKRFVNVPDRLFRIDAKRLAVRARASFPSSVATLEHGRRMWASIGDGRVVRLDPRQLAIERSRRILPARAVATRGLTLSKPALGLGSLWVLAGDETDLELVRMDPVSLTVRSKTRIPTGGVLAQALNHVVADTGHVYVVGSAIAGVDAKGRLLARPARIPGLVSVEIHGPGLVGLTGGKPALVLLDARGRLLGRTRLLDVGARLAVSGENAWFLGDAGGGEGIVHVRLAAPTTRSCAPPRGPGDASVHSRSLRVTYISCGTGRKVALSCVRFTYGRSGVCSAVGLRWRCTSAKTAGSESAEHCTAGRRSMSIVWTD
jgi:hypothetical protein